MFYSGSGCMIVLVAGFSGTGKTTLVEGIAKEFGLRAVHASNLFRKTFKQDTKTVGWWEKKGMKFIDKRLQNSSIDKSFDGFLLKEIRKGNIACDSWTLPWLFRGKAFRIWVKCSLKERAERVAERDSITAKKALEKIKEKDKKTALIYKKIYGFEAGRDFKPFNLVIDSSGLRAEQTFGKARKAIENWKKRHCLQ